MWRALKIRAVCLALATAGATLAISAPALAAQTIYFVQGTGDAPAAACAPTTSAAGLAAERCDTLRAAVAAANANVGGADEIDVIFLQAAGTYQLSQPSELVLTDDVSIVGRGPRTTAVAGNGSARVFSVRVGANASLNRLAVIGGRAPSSEGGNVLNRGLLILTGVRVSGGAAQAGGGIANYGQLSAIATLIENNEATTNGAGLLNRGLDGQADVLLTNSTIALNRSATSGAGVASVGGSVNLTHVTVARNQITGTGTGAGIYAAATGDEVSANGSIVANNTGGDVTNCGGSGTFVESAAGTNVTNLGGVGDCGFDRNGTIGLAAALSDQGGDTDVLTIDPLFLAKSAVAPCFIPSDQRNAPRPSGACDAGAFQEGAVAPPIDSGPEPEPGGGQPPVVTPTPTPPVPTPTPTPTPEPTPTFNREVVVEPLRGTVLVCPPRSRRCDPLRAGDAIPMGSTIDTKKGEVKLTSLSSRGGKPQTAKFRDGIFRVSQSGDTTDLTLTEELDCRNSARSAQKKPKSRKLWGDGKGKFRTKGRYAAATVRGTRWLVQDTCTTTLVRVTQGSVAVRDTVKRRNVIVRKGKSYVARRR